MSPDTYLKHLEAFGLLAEGSSFFCMAVDNKAFAVADRWRWVSWRVGRRWVAAGRRGGKGGIPPNAIPQFSASQNLAGFGKARGCLGWLGILPQEEAAWR